MIRVIIVDDEKYIREELRYFLGKIENIEVVAETGEGDEVLKLIEETKPDIVFLDIELKYANGMTIARQIKDMENHPQIIISTAYDKYAIMGFEIAVSDYILKPFSLERIKSAINKASAEAMVYKQSLENYQSDKSDETEDLKMQNQNQNKEIKKIAVNKDDRMFLIDTSDAVYFESRGSEVDIVTLEQKYKVSLTLKELEASLDMDKFFRIHRSFIVNMDYVIEIIPWFNYTCKLVLQGDKGELIVSRSNFKEFKEKFRF